MHVSMTCVGEQQKQFFCGSIHMLCVGEQQKNVCNIYVDFTQDYLWTPFSSCLSHFDFLIFCLPTNTILFIGMKKKPCINLEWYNGVFFPFILDKLHF